MAASVFSTGCFCNVPAQNSGKRGARAFARSGLLARVMIIMNGNND